MGESRYAYLVPELERLRGEGVGWKRCAKLLGMSQTTARRLVDPAFAEENRRRSLAAKRRRRGTCRVCGRETAYSGHGKGVSDLCAACAVQEQSWPRYALDHLARCYERGESPFSFARRVYPDEDPYQLQGTLGHHVAKATRMRPHAPGGWTRVPVDEAIRRYQAGESISRIARELGAATGSVYFQLVRHGVHTPKAR